jgi:thiamine biosynthesis lipoprotein
MTKKVASILVALFVLFLLGMLLLSLTARGPVELDGGSRFVMGTVARVVAVAPDSKTARASIEAAFTRIHDVDRLMSDYKPDSEISRVNAEAFQRPVAVSPQTFDVIQKALQFSRISQGAFDITIGPLVDLWRRANDANSLPTEAELLDARSRVGAEKLILDPNRLTVRFTVDAMRLDLGGIAKGYAIDRAVEAMQQTGAIGGMVDIGGDILCFGQRPDKNTDWLIGLQDPNHPDDFFGAGEPLLVLVLRNVAVATSGGYRRFALVEGKRHSHIIDAHTGQSSDRLTSVTIIAQDAVTADALATAVSVLGAQVGLELVEKTPRAEAIVIPADHAAGLAKTSGADQYIR